MKSALLVIDVQKGFFAPEASPFDAEPVISRINELSDRARKAGVPVIFIQHETGASGGLANGSAGWELDTRLKVGSEDHLICKTTPDSFLRTRLTELLTKLDVSDIVICGYATEFCVDTTTRRAAGLKFNVILASDAHTTHDKPHADGENIREHHNATLPSISSFGVTIKALPTDEIAFSYEKHAPAAY